MIITCGECKTQFAVPSAAIGTDGRKVKCSQCSHTWHQLPLDKLSDTTNVEEPPEEKKPIPKGGSLPTVKEPQKAGMGLKVAFATMLLFAVFTAVLFNQDTFPGLHNFYTAMGMQKTDGLQFKKFKVTRVDERLTGGNSITFIVEASIINESNETREVPDIIATPLTKEGREYGKVHIIKPLQKTLEPFETMRVSYDITGVRGRADRIMLDIGNKWERFFRSSKETHAKYDIEPSDDKEDVLEYDSLPEENPNGTEDTAEPEEKVEETEELPPATDEATPQQH